MTKLLALETSGALCSVAVHADGIWSEDTQNVQRLHNQVLLRQIDGILERRGIGARAIEVVAFGAGPGSFTGVRIAAATAQAIAFAGGGLVVPVPSSRALAEAALQSGRIAAAVGIITVIRSRRDAHYLATYALRSGLLEPRLPDALYLGLEAPEFGALHGWVGVGDRPPWWGDAFVHVPFIEGCTATAAVIGRLALAIHADGGAVAPEAALPLYVAGDSPWKALPGTSGPQDASDAPVALRGD